jgi:hypothetical protein
MAESARKAFEMDFIERDLGEDHDRNLELHPGDICPECPQGRLDYDGMLNLSCSECGFSLSGCFT